MKYMISCRHTLVDLQQTDEIKVEYKDRARLGDFITDKWKCDKEVYVYLPKDEVIDWDNLNTYKDVLSLHIAVEDTDLIQFARQRGFKVHWSYPATSYWELRGLLALGVDEVLIDAPLYFDLPKVKQACGDTEIRLVVNKCFNNYMKRRNGICGTYVRPEDVDAYAEYVDHMEFDTDDLRKEMALLNIYKEKHWPGNLNILLTNLNENVDNRGFDEDFARKRISCYQSCQRDGRCHYCISQFKFVTTLLKNKENVAAEIKEIDDKTQVK